MLGLPAISLNELDVEYARFNSQKTVGDPRPSAFTVARVGPLIVLGDPNRRGTYYNRVLGLNETSLPYLRDALASLPAGAVRVDVDEPADEEVASRLRELGLSPAQRIVWLYAPTRHVAPSARVRRLRRDERDRVREVLELEGPIDPAIWRDRRALLCTDQFRAFVIERGRTIASLATTFVGSRGAVLGSAFTRVEHRGRGYQTALLQARLDDAARLGLSWVVTDVEPDTTSLRNCLRVGFEVYRTQAHWERSG